MKKEKFQGANWEGEDFLSPHLLVTPANSRCSVQFRHAIPWVSRAHWSEALTHVENCCIESFVPFCNPWHKHLRVSLSVFISHTAGSQQPLPANIHFKMLPLKNRGGLARHREHAEERHGEGGKNYLKKQKLLETYKTFQCHWFST